jgi:hypothetical protein
MGVEELRLALPLRSSLKILFLAVVMVIIIVVVIIVVIIVKEGRLNEAVVTFRSDG